MFWGCLTTESSLKKSLKKLKRKTSLRQLSQTQTLFELRLTSRKVNALNGEPVVFQYRSKKNELIIITGKVMSQHPLKC